MRRFKFYLFDRIYHLPREYVVVAANKHLARRKLNQAWHKTIARYTVSRAHEIRGAA